MKLAPLMIVTTAAFTLTACGGSGSSGQSPPGPNVVGEALPQAERELQAAGISFSEHAKDGVAGILVKDNWVVCDEKYVGPSAVRLDAPKHGC